MIYYLFLTKQNEKQLTLQQQQLSDLLQAEDVSENQVYEWKTELQSVAKGLFMV